MLFMYARTRYARSSTLLICQPFSTPLPPSISLSLFFNCHFFAPINMLCCSVDDDRTTSNSISSRRRCASGTEFFSFDGYCILVACVCTGALDCT